VLFLEKKDPFPKVAYLIFTTFIIKFIMDFVKDRGSSLTELVILIIS